MKQDLCEICIFREKSCDDGYVIVEHEGLNVVKCNEFEMRITLEQVLQDLYDSEINVSIDWEWDGGIDITFLYPIELDEVVNTKKVSEIPLLLIEKARKHYPQSTFVEKYQYYKKTEGWP